MRGGGVACALAAVASDQRRRIPGVGADPARVIDRAVDRAAADPRRA